MDDQAIEVWKDLLPDPKSGREFAEFQTDFNDYPNLQQHFGTPYQDYGGTITTWQMSHERTGEMLTLNQKYGLPFYKFKHWKAEDGVAQWNNLSLPDYTKPNPFKMDEKDEDGYIIGRPALYYIVDDDQLEQPRDDRGLKLFREQIAGWDYVPVKITETGLTVEKPSKVNDDLMDSTKAMLHYFGMEPTPLTKMESIRAKMPVEMQEADTELDRVNRGYWLQQEAKRQQIQEQQKQSKSLGLGSMGGALDRFDRMRGR
jgi:hypothetical protein